MKRKPLSIGKATLLALTLSILLAPFVLIGPFISGFIARARMGGKGTIIGPAILPAILWGAAWYFGVNHSWRIGKELVDPVALGLIIISPITAIAFFAGSVAGGGAIPTRLMGFAMLLGCGIWLSIPVRQAANLYKTAVSSTPPAIDAATTDTCESHLKKLYNALQQYADAYDGTLPPSDRWVKALQDPSQSFISKEESTFLHCPQSSGNAGYAMNKVLSGKRIKTITDLAGTPLLYDTNLPEYNASDNLESLPKPGRHGGKNFILNLNGTITAK